MNLLVIDYWMMKVRCGHTLLFLNGILDNGLPPILCLFILGLSLSLTQKSSPNPHAAHRAPLAFLARISTISLQKHPNHSAPFINLYNIYLFHINFIFSSYISSPNISLSLRPFAFSPYTVIEPMKFWN